MSRSLDGRLILVTGSAKRIGRAIALRLARSGARVLIHYHTSAEEAAQTARDCAWQNEPAPALQANLASVSEIHRLFEEIESRYGRLDALVNNAARFTRFDPLAITEADWDFIHDVNLKAAFFCCQQAARLMQAQGEGRIVVLSSLGGIRPWADHAHYCASKAGLIMLVQALAKAWAPEIQVNSVAPGLITHEETDEIARKLIAATPAKRTGAEDEVAQAVEFFLTTTTFITGQTLAVDGGLSQR